MRKSSIFYSMIFVLAFGLFAYPVSAQMTDTPSEGGISQSMDPSSSEDFQRGYKEGFDAGFSQGRSEAAGEVRGYTPGDTSPSSSEIRNYEGSDTEPATREAPETSGGRWNVPGVDSKVDRGGPGY
ncbi:MAG: hypothetical protein C4530_02905 [Desulfobacteraceae bacterium]|nr:MAG: hypothetical protein C4530_02905 [Desulfobacteraceae bacterium]